jgi:O-antigen/teichoic acid export membrane protein
LEDSLKKRYFIKLLASFVAGIINIVLVAIVPKALGPVAFGQFSYIQQFFSQIIAFLDAGTSTAFFTKLSAKNERKELISFYFYFSLFLLFVLFLVIYTIDIFHYSSTFLPEIPAEYIYYGLLFGFFTWMTQTYIKISDAYAITVSVEMIKIVHKVLTLILLLCMIHFLVFDLSTYFYFHFISLFSFILIISLLFIKKSIFTKDIFHFSFTYKNLVKEFYRFASPLFVFNIVAISIALFDIWLLQYVSGSVETGFYGLAYAIAAMCFLFTGAMTPLITREFSKSFEQKNMHKIQELFKRYIPMLYSIAAFFGVFIAFESKELISIFTDQEFNEAYVALMIMAFYPVHQTYGQLSGSLFFAMEETKLYRNIGLIVSLFGLIFTYVFIYVLEWGAVGFAWKMVLIQIIGVNIQLFFNVKSLKVRMFPFLLHQVVSLLFFILMAYLSTQLFFPEENGIIYFILKGLLYTLMSLMGILFSPYIISSSRSDIITLFKKLKEKM